MNKTLLWIAQQNIVTARGILLLLGYKKHPVEDLYDTYDLIDILNLLEEAVEKILEEKEQ
jgi:hypothetical protein